MKKIYFFIILILFTVAAFGQRPIITKWNAVDGRIYLPTEGNYSYVYYKSDNPAITGGGTGMSGSKEIVFPVPGIYNVHISPASVFKFTFINSTASLSSRFLEISQWGDVTWSTNLRGMFYNCSNFNITATDIPDFSKVTNMSYMFYYARAFNSPINSWNVENVTDFTNMFDNAVSFNQDLNSWNTAKAATMQGMFVAASAFNGLISNWNVGTVTDMSYMFYYATGFNQDLNLWNVQKVLNMAFMFNQASNYNQDLGLWNLKSGVNMRNMLDSSGMKCENYSKTLSGWALNPTTPTNVTLGAGGRTYGTAAQQYRTTLDNDKGWTINGDAYDAACTVSLSVPIIKPAASRLVLYPQPTTGILSLEAPESGIARLYNAAGQELRSFSVTRGINTLNITNLPAGVYWLTAVRRVARIIKN